SHAVTVGTPGNIAADLAAVLGPGAQSDGNTLVYTRTALTAPAAFDFKLTILTSGTVGARHDAASVSLTGTTGTQGDVWKLALPGATGMSTVPAGGAL